MGGNRKSTFVLHVDGLDMCGSFFYFMEFKNKKPAPKLNLVPVANEQTESKIFFTDLFRSVIRGKSK
jgi:hypothetical protein